MGQALQAFINEHGETILTDYLALVRGTVARYQYGEPPGFEDYTRRLISLFPRAGAAPRDPQVLAYLTDLCEERVQAGVQMSEILEAMFLYDDVMLPIITRGQEPSEQRTALIMEVLEALEVFALRFTEVYVGLQMALFEEQRMAALELSTPVIKVWDGILALPLIGTIDSYRAKRVMEELLRAVSTEQADIVLIDITGVPVVDTMVADHLIRTIKAVELLGTECLVVGIGPEFAQTVVALGVDLTSITPSADMRQGLTEAFRRLGLAVVPRSALDKVGLS